MNTATVPEQWHDSRRYLWLMGILTMLLPAAAIRWYDLSGWEPALWFGPVFVFGVIPLLDWMLGEDDNNPPEEAVAELERDQYYRFAVYLAVPVQYVSFILACWAAVTFDLSWVGYLGLAITTGTSMGIAINTAHELGHKPKRHERWLAKIALAPVAYGHFFIEHNRGHHVRVSTPEDPASSRYGENFYEFLPRTVIGSVRSAWELEKQRLERLGLPAWHWKNHNLNAWSLTVLLWAGLITWLGWMAVPFLLIQAVFGFQLLEVVNYLEHYGLLRQKKESGRYERCQPEHSWNSNRRVTNIFLYQLQRHSDHHANPTRGYEALRHFDEAPQLPGGYASMILVAWIPPLWFKVMNPRVKAHYNGDMSKVNIHPRVRDKVLAKEAA